jgi:rhodanese-related sulfurtransferase/copper chaperone CopZ
MKKLLLTLAAALIAFTGISRAEDYGDISIADLKKAIADNKVAVIDVNGSESWKAGHIPGAIDFAASKDKLAEALPKDKSTLVVAYCGGPSCAAYKAGAKAAVALGYTNVKHLKDGISGWKKAGEKTEAGGAKKEDAKKTSAAPAEKHTYVATFTGLSCAACEKAVSTAIAKLPGGADVKIEAGKAEGTKLVSFTATNCGCETSTKDALVTALGDDAKTFVVTSLVAKK